MVMDMQFGSERSIFAWSVDCLRATLIEVSNSVAPTIVLSMLGKLGVRISTSVLRVYKRFSETLTPKSLGLMFLQ